MRKAGRSMQYIAQSLNVAKSSVSEWVRDIELSFSKLEKLRQNPFSSVAIERRRISRLRNEQEKRDKLMNAAAADFTSLSQADLKVIGIIFYWAEGGKTERGMIRFANSDPAVIKIAMRFFREICGVKEEKFRGHIHTHSHLNSKKALKYWSEITRIPLRQFYKVYSKPSIASKNKRDSLPYGTLDIVICDTSLFLRVMGWINKIKQILTSS